MIPPSILKAWTQASRYVSLTFVPLIEKVSEFFQRLNDFSHYLSYNKILVLSINFLFLSSDIWEDDFRNVPWRNCAKDSVETCSWSFVVWGCCSSKIGTIICIEVCFKYFDSFTVTVNKHSCMLWSHTQFYLTCLGQYRFYCIFETRNSYNSLIFRWKI